MMQTYVTFADGTQVVFSRIIMEKGQKTVFVHFERPTTDGFDSARISLPTYRWITKDGFTDEEIEHYQKFAERHAHHFFYYAENGGWTIANAV